MSHSGHSRFKRDIIQGIGSSGVSLAVTLVTTPLMTRIFPADAYGINGIMMSAATLISALGLFGLPAALAREQSGPEQARLFHSSAQLALVLGSACALIALGSLFVPSEISPAFQWAILMLPLMVMAHAMQRISDSLETARGLFSAQASARIANAVTGRGFTVAGGWLMYPSVVVMLAGDILGKLVHVATTARHGKLGNDWKTLQWRPNKAALCETFKAYRHYALHANVAGVMPIAMVLGIQALIGIRLDMNATGQYVLASSILTLPAALIAMATAPILFHRFVQTMDHRPDRLRSQVLLATSGYLLAGIICMLPFILFGPDIFAFIFGERWRQAGEVAAILSIPNILAFSLTTVLSLFRVANRVRAWLGFEIVGVALVLAGVALMPAVDDLNAIIVRLAILLTAYQVLMHAACLWVSFHPATRRPACPAGED